MIYSNIKRILLFVFLLLCPFFSWAADTDATQPEDKKPKTEVESKTSPELANLVTLIDPLNELTQEFQDKLDSFDPEHIQDINEAERQTITAFGHAQSFYQKNFRYFCDCSKMSGTRARGMARLVKEVEKSIVGEEYSTAAFLFIGSGAAITEYIALDTLLKRNSELRIVIDFIDPIYLDPYNRSSEGLEGMTRQVVHILLKSLNQRHANRIINYQLRNDNFCYLPNYRESLPFIFYEIPASIAQPQKQLDSSLWADFSLHKTANEARGLNSASSLLSPDFHMHISSSFVRKTMFLVGFDLESGGGLESFINMSNVLGHINIKPTENKYHGKIFAALFSKPGSWQIKTILVADGKISVFNPLSARKSPQL